MDGNAESELRGEGRGASAEDDQSDLGAGQQRFSVGAFTRHLQAHNHVLPPGCTPVSVIRTTLLHIAACKTFCESL